MAALSFHQCKTIPESDASISQCAPGKGFTFTLQTEHLKFLLTAAHTRYSIGYNRIYPTSTSYSFRWDGQEPNIWLLYDWPSSNYTSRLGIDYSFQLLGISVWIQLKTLFKNVGWHDSTLTGYTLKAYHSLSKFCFRIYATSCSLHTVLGELKCSHYIRYFYAGSESSLPIFSLPPLQLTFSQLQL